MRAWWTGLEPRERRVVMAGVLVVLVALVYAGVWLPLADAQAREASRRAARVETLAWIRQAGAEVEALRRGGARGVSSGGRSLLAEVDISTQGAGIGDAVDNIQPEERGRVGVTVTAVGFDALVRWLEWLRGRGVTVVSLSLQRETRTPRVSGRVVLVREAG